MLHYINNIASIWLNIRRVLRRMVTTRQEASYLGHETHTDRMRVFGHDWRDDCRDGADFNRSIRQVPSLSAIKEIAQFAGGSGKTGFFYTLFSSRKS